MHGSNADRLPLGVLSASSIVVTGVTVCGFETGFLDQFEPVYKRNKIDARSPHSVRASLNAAIEQSVVEPSPEAALAILIRASNCGLSRYCWT